MLEDKENQKNVAFKNDSYSTPLLLLSPQRSTISPRIRRASCMSFGMIVTRFAWIAAKLASARISTCAHNLFCFWDRFCTGEVSALLQWAAISFKEGLSQQASWKTTHSRICGDPTSRFTIFMQVAEGTRQKCLSAVLDGFDRGGLPSRALCSDLHGANRNRIALLPSNCDPNID